MTKTMKSKPHGNRYPWTALFARGRFTLYRGVEYTGMSHGMASTVRQAAVRIGVRVRLRVFDDRVEVDVLRKADVNGQRMSN